MSLPPGSPRGGAAATGSSFVSEAAKYIGVPYVWGGASPKGFDCSGLVAYSLHQMGIRNVPRTSEQQWQWVQRISQKQLQPGDLIFEQWPGEASPGHVAVYAGNGQIIQAPAPGENVQKVKWSPSIVHAQGGQIVGYGRVPGLTYSGSAGKVGGASTGAGSAGGTGNAAVSQSAQSVLTGASQAVKSTGPLLHGAAVVIDRVFNMFSPGQGWRLTFGAGAVVMFLMSYKAFTGGGVHIGRG